MMHHPLGELVREFGRPMETPSGTLTRLFPEADVLAEAELSRVGLPQARAQALREVARAVAGGTLRFDSALGLDDAVEQLAALDGIGPWTAQYVLMRGIDRSSSRQASPSGSKVSRSIMDAPKSSGKTNNSANGSTS